MIVCEHSSLTKRKLVTVSSCVRCTFSSAPHTPSLLSSSMYLSGLGLLLAFRQGLIQTMMALMELRRTLTSVLQFLLSKCWDYRDAHTTWALGFSYKWHQAGDGMLELLSFTSLFKAYPCWLTFVDIHTFIHSSVGLPWIIPPGELWCLHVVVWAGDLWACVLMFTAHVPRNRIVGSCGNSEFKTLTTGELFSKVEQLFYGICSKVQKSRQFPKRNWVWASEICTQENRTDGLSSGDSDPRDPLLTNGAKPLLQNLDSQKVDLWLAVCSGELVNIM